MALKNQDIVKRIKDARIEQKLTQKDLAEYLGRTSAAISDLERGKVQVTAIDLHKLSSLLKKPIEYFYGEDLGGKELRDFAFVMRQAPANTRKQIITSLQQSIRLYQLVERAQELDDNNPNDRPKLWKIAQDFYELAQEANQHQQLAAQEGRKLQEKFARLLTPDNQAQFLAGEPLPDTPPKPARKAK